MYEDLKRYKEEHGGSLKIVSTSTTGEDGKEGEGKKEYAELSRWIRGQHNEYKYYKEGQPSSMFPAKIKKLLDIGFEFSYVSVEERFRALVEFKTTHGHYIIPPEHPILGKWVERQKKAAKKFANGDPTPYFECMIKDLRALGLDLDPARPIVAPITSSSTTTISGVAPSSSSTDPTDVSSSTTAPAVAAQTSSSLCPVPNPEGSMGEQQQPLAQQQLPLQQPQQLPGMDSIKGETPDEEEDRKWNECFEQLRTYKLETGTCEVPPSHHTPLSYWVTKQHQEYQKVKEGTGSKLTVNRLQKLNDLGFVFRKMGKTHTWEERMEQLRKYKEEHGHSKVPKSHPELGVFVNRQRYEYTKWIQGRPSTMNEKRKKDLEGLDFVFVAGKKMSHVDFKNKKTWDERYTELLQFREVYGHAVVPQSYPGLGEWVHTQRTYYKKLKQGKRSPLTPERVLRLADVGFVFDATKRRGNHVPDDDPSNTPAPAVSAVSAVPPAPAVPAVPPSLAVPAVPAESPAPTTLKEL